MPSATKNLFEKRFLDFQKLLIVYVIVRDNSCYPWFIKFVGKSGLFILLTEQQNSIKIIYATNSRRTY